MKPHPLGWPNALHPSRSPCRIDAGKGDRQHPCSAAHADVVEGYRLWREVEERREEEETHGYSTERAERRASGVSAPTFRAYLLGLARTA